jgi:hypothetical protein
MISNSNRTLRSHSASNIDIQSQPLPAPNSTLSPPTLSTNNIDENSNNNNPTLQFQPPGPGDLSAFPDHVAPVLSAVVTGNSSNNNNHTEGNNNTTHNNNHSNTAGSTDASDGMGRAAGARPVPTTSSAAAAIQDNSSLVIQQLQAQVNMMMELLVRRGHDSPLEPQLIRESTIVHMPAPDNPKVKHSRTIPNDLPSFRMTPADTARTNRRSYTDIDKFVIALERAARANLISLEDDTIVRMMPVLTNDAIAAWLDRLLSDKPGIISWILLKPYLVNHYRDLMQYDRDQRLFESMFIQPGQTLASFTDQYVEHMRKLEYDEKAHVHSQHLLQRLPTYVARQIASMKITQSNQASVLGLPDPRPMSVEDIVRISLQMEANNNYYVGSGSPLSAPPRHVHSTTTGVPFKNQEANTRFGGHSSRPPPATTSRSMGTPTPRHGQYNCTLHGTNASHDDKDCIAQGNKRASMGTGQGQAGLGYNRSATTSLIPRPGGTLHYCCNI